MALAVLAIPIVAFAGVGFEDVKMLADPGYKSADLFTLRPGSTYYRFTYTLQSGGTYVVLIPTNLGTVDEVIAAVRAGSISAMITLQDNTPLNKGH